MRQGMNKTPAALPPDDVLDTMKPVTVYLTLRQKAWLDEEARREGIKSAEFLRAVIDHAREARQEGRAA